MSVSTLEFPKLPKRYAWSVQYDPTLRTPSLRVQIKFLGLFTAESRSGNFNLSDPDITPKRLRSFAIALAINTYKDFQRGRDVDALHEAAAFIARDLNSGDPKKVSY